MEKRRQSAEDRCAKLAADNRHLRNGLALRQAEKEFFVANSLANQNQRYEAGLHYKKASELAWWEKRYYTYVAINQEIIGRSSNIPSRVKLESLEQSIQSPSLSYLKPPKTASSRIQKI